MVFLLQAKCQETGVMVAIEKVLQDKRYKNRELQIMGLLDHPNVVQLKHFFLSTTVKNEVYLNLVMEYVSETLYRRVKYYNKMNQHMPLICVQLYSYQVSLEVFEFLLPYVVSSCVTFIFILLFVSYGDDFESLVRLMIGRSG